MNTKPNAAVDDKLSSSKLEFPLVVEAWKKTAAGKKYLEASTVVDEYDELQRFEERWSNHTLVTRSLSSKEKRARGIENHRSWFSKLFN